MKQRNDGSGSFYSLKFERKDAAQKPAAKQAPADSGFDSMDSDIPFATSSMFYDMTTSKQRKMQRYDY